MSVLAVGAGQTYPTLSAAIAASHDGDFIVVRAGTYANDFATINTKIFIEGVGGMVNLVATTPPPNGKAILVTNTDVTLDNISFSGAAVADGNGAGIRYQGGQLTLNNCFFHDNQDGLLAADAPAGSITINDSEFSHNGSGDGNTHNLYVGQIGKLTINGSWLHDAVVGHEMKSRALSTLVENSRITDGTTGTASYSIDLPNGGSAVIKNNIIEQGPASQNPAIIHFGGEGAPYAGSSLNVIGNTILNDLPSRSAAAVVNQSMIPVSFTDNAVVGLTAGQLITGAGTDSGTTFPATSPGYSDAHPYVTSDTILLKLSETGGAMSFIVSVDSYVQGAAQTVTAVHQPGMDQSFALTGAFGAGTHMLTIRAVAPVGTGNGLLYVDGLTFDGMAHTGAAAGLGSHQFASFIVAHP